MNRVAASEEETPTGSSQSDERDSVSRLLGARIRQEREAAGVTVRGLAAKIGVSPSLISQIERDRATPSVATLWALASELQIPIGELFNDPLTGSPQRAASSSPVQQHETRKAITLDGGVRWERLTPEPEDDIDFVYVVYPVGAESCPPDALTRHGGKEYGYVISGTLAVQIGFETHVLRTNDSISFDAVRPHRLSTVGNRPAVAVWMVINRSDDHRVASSRDGAVPS